MSEILGISPVVLIALIFVCVFVVTVVIFYLYTIRSISNSNSDNHTDTSSLHNSNDDEEEGRLSMASVDDYQTGSSTMLSTLPFRSSSNISLLSLIKNTKKCIESKANSIRWIASSRIGSGGYSEVYHVIDECSKKSLAMKWIRIEKNMAKREASQSLFKTFHFESELLNKIDHPNIITYFGRSVAENEMTIYLELAPCGNLLNFISVYAANANATSADTANHQLPEHLIRRFSIDVLSALNYLHSLTIVHRDIKCANLLVMNDGAIKVSDFGASCRLKETSSEELDTQGTYNWMAPEMISSTNENPYGDKVDIWSFGCCLIEMSAGSAPWTETNKYGPRLMYHIATFPDIPRLPKTSDNLNLLMSNCLKRNPKDRLSAAELLSNSFLNDIADIDEVE